MSIKDINKEMKTDHGKDSEGGIKAIHSNKGVVARVVAIIVDKLNVPAEEVVPSAHFVNDLGADSLDQVELVMEFEKEFDLCIKDDQATKLQTVGSVIKYLEENLIDGHVHGG